MAQFNERSRRDYMISMILSFLIPVIGFCITLILKVALKSAKIALKVAEKSLEASLAVAKKEAQDILGEPSEGTRAVLRKGSKVAGKLKDKLNPVNIVEDGVEAGRKVVDTTKNVAEKTKNAAVKTKNAAVKTKNAAKKTAKTAKKAAKTTKKVAKKTVKTTKKVAKGTVKAAKKTVKASKKAVELTIKALKLLIRFISLLIKLIQALITILSAVFSLVGLIVLLIIVALLAAVIGVVMAISAVGTTKTTSLGDTMGVGGSDGATSSSGGIKGYDKWLFIGDSRTVGLTSNLFGSTLNSGTQYIDTTEDGVTETYEVIAMSGEDISWFKTRPFYTDEKFKDVKGYNVVYNMGVNGMADANYEFLGELPEDFLKNNCVLAVSLNPVTNAKTAYVDNPAIVEYNETYKSYVDGISGITWVDTYTAMMEKFDTDDTKDDLNSSLTDGEGLHYTKEGYQFIFDTVQSVITSSADSGSSEETTKASGADGTTGATTTTVVAVTTKKN